jgi:hypothetical protein
MNVTLDLIIQPGGQQVGDPCCWTFIQKDSNSNLVYRYLIIPIPMNLTKKCMGTLGVCFAFFYNFCLVHGEEGGSVKTQLS